MNNLVIITSVIDTPNIPLSYSNVRSLFTREERFNDTKKTIESVKEKIPNCKILLVECSNLTKIEYEYFISNSDYVINLWNNPELHPKIFGISKSLGEGTMTIEALNFIITNHIKYDNLFKISGRYWLNAEFNFNIFDNDKQIFKKIDNDSNNISTVLYKITKSDTKLLYKFLNDNYESMKRCIGYEIMFGNFVKLLEISNINFYDKLGISGKVTVCGSNYSG